MIFYHIIYASLMVIDSSDTSCMDVYLIGRLYTSILCIKYVEVQSKSSVISNWILHPCYGCQSTGFLPDIKCSITVGVAHLDRS